MLLMSFVGLATKVKSNIKYRISKSACENIIQYDDKHNMYKSQHLPTQFTVELNND